MRQQLQYESGVRYSKELRAAEKSVVNSPVNTQYAVTEKQVIIDVLTKLTNNTGWKLYKGGTTAILQDADTAKLITVGNKLTTHGFEPKQKEVPGTEMKALLIENIQLAKMRELSAVNKDCIARPTIHTPGIIQ